MTAGLFVLTLVLWFIVGVFVQYHLEGYAFGTAMCAIIAGMTFLGVATKE